jgi:DNA-binding IscR family transcriptional regulator
LEVAPDQLSVLEVIKAVDPVKRIERCPLDLEQHGTRLCPLHKRLDRVVAEVEEAFGSFTIQDLISEPAESKPLGLSYARDLSGI